MVGAASASIQLVVWLVVKLRGPAPEPRDVELALQRQQGGAVRAEGESQPSLASSTVNPPPPPVAEPPAPPVDEPVVLPHNPVA